MVKKVLKKIIPKKVKEYVKKQVGANSYSPQSVEYVVRRSDEKKMDKKCIIITGGTGAIGSAVVHRLYLEGATIGVCGRNIDKVNELIKRIKKESSGGVLIPLKLDVSDDKNIETAIDSFVKKTGRLDAFINNAGGGARSDSKPIHEQSIEIIDMVLNTNLRGTIVCSRKAAQIMVKQNYGKIINMSSVVGMQGKSTMSDYAASKSGIIGFTKSLALELGKYNISVNCVSPGMVNQIPFDKGMPVKSSSKNVLGRFGYTDEVAAMISYILSDEADYVTGQNLVIDGGRSLGLMGD
ncbi:MAG: SDR family oxidoreductase [Ruminococcus flavefaciens]|nr:SDR family oxidoreductase [Ruminococcus flavefaciens]